MYMYTYIPICRYTYYVYLSRNLTAALFLSSSFSSSSLSLSLFSDLLVCEFFLCGVSLDVRHRGCISSHLRPRGGRVITGIAKRAAWMRFAKSALAANSLYDTSHSRRR